ncbi:MAG: UDP-3-O-acyl-N-acetylglucosamine deacetylase [Alphaproteobacteria bacterium]|nr:UDP-3-O-acyl-N-acetylglucosamine deacetylase [Alphaproteobacteria bacterium]MBQ7127799.1 UDP-3-O-acyl-N-acetylglucosamine deacetylase [Alphaproteobacteria bacterium]
MNTVTKNIEINGRGIHSGLPVSMVIKPSNKPGIFFRRVDMVGTGLIPARFDNVGETKMRNTTVGKTDSAHVQTIEHLMAALFMCGVDSAIIEINGPETPILDGSAAEFYKLISDAVQSKNKMKKIVVRRPVIAYAREVTKQLPLFVRAQIWIMNKISGRKADGFVSLSPNDGKSLDVVATLVYPEKIIGKQSFEYSFNGTKKSIDDFIKNIARARTFGKYSEWEYLKARGMGRGADETNVIALNDAGDGTINELNWPDEFVRHKIIDAIGDMFTAGGMICGKLESYKGSHALNNIVLKKLFSDPSNYDIVE